MEHVPDLQRSSQCRVRMASTMCYILSNSFSTWQRGVPCVTWAHGLSYYVLRVVHVIFQNVLDLLSHLVVNVLHVLHVVPVCSNVLLPVMFHVYEILHSV